MTDSRADNRLRGIDGLRGVAALAVLVHHVAQLTPHTPGFTWFSVQANHGLTLFFVLSGFLLYRPFAAAVLDRRPMPSTSRYLRNRWLRIYPAYIVILLLSAFVLRAVYTGGTPQLGHPAGSPGSVTELVASVFLVQTYIPETMMAGLGVAWSLTAEVAFYLVLPVLAAAAALVARRTGRTVLAVLLPPTLMVVVGVATFAWLTAAAGGLPEQAVAEFAWGHTWTAVLSRSMLAAAALFGLGMAAAVAVQIVRRQHVAVSPVGRSALLVAAAVVAGGAVKLGSDWAPVMGVAVVLTLIAVTAAGPGPNRVAAGLEWAPLRFFGDISYSVYLWHLPVLWWLQQHGLLGVYGPPAVWNVAAVVAATTVLSVLTYRLVEKPALAMKVRRRASVDPGGVAVAV